MHKPAVRAQGTPVGLLALWCEAEGVNEGRKPSLFIPRHNICDQKT